MMCLNIPLLLIAVYQGDYNKLTTREIEPYEQNKKEP